MRPYYSPGAIEPTPNVTPVTSTFSLLMKIVRNLALKRDDPEGREQHKRFVEQQFIGSNIRIDRVIDECGVDLSQLIKLFDLILRRIDRSRHELSEFLFTVQNCKTMLLVQRSDCRKLWFQLIGQKTMLATYDQIVELRKVRPRCRVYVGCGYFLQAVELLSKAKDTLKNLVEKLGLPPFDMLATTSTAAVSSLSFHGSAGKSSLLSAHTEHLVDASSSLPANRQDSGSSQTEAMRRHAASGLGQVDDELNCAVTELMSSLKLASEICVFGSTTCSFQGNPFLAANRKMNAFKSAETQLWWKRLHCGNALGSGTADGEIYNEGTLPAAYLTSSCLEGFQYSELNSSSATKISISALDGKSDDPKFESRLICLLSSGLSFESHPIITNDRPSIFSLETDVDNHDDSLATYFKYIVKCAGMLPVQEDATAALQTHMADILPMRLDQIALLHAKCISVQSPFILRHFDAESSALVSECVRPGPFRREFISSLNSSQSHLLLLLLVRMFEHYKQIAQSYKVLISCLKAAECEGKKEIPPSSASRKDTDSSDDAITRLTTDLVWSNIQKPLTVALLAHVVDDIDSYGNKQELLSLANNVAAVPITVTKFNSNLILMLYQRINSQPMVAAITRQSKFQVEKAKKPGSGEEDLMDTSIMLDDLSLDIDQLFLSQTSSFTGLSSYGLSSHGTSKSHNVSASSSQTKSNLSGLLDTSYSRRLTLAPNQQDIKQRTISNIEGKLFRFERSTHIKNVTRWYGGKRRHHKSESASEDLLDRSRSQPALKTSLQSSFDEGTPQKGSPVQPAAEHSLVDIFGIRDILVCVSSYKHFHYIYYRLRRICTYVDMQTNMETSDDTGVLQLGRTTYENKISLLRNSMDQFIKNMYFNKLKAAAQETISVQLSLSSRLTELTPDSLISSSDAVPECGINLKSHVKILLFSYRCIQAINNLFVALGEMRSYLSEFWSVINEIIVAHTSNTSNVWTNPGSTSSLSPLSVEWVRDVDVNRHLRSMPLLNDVISIDDRRYQTANRSAINLDSSNDRLNVFGKIQSINYDTTSARRKSTLISFGSKNLSFNKSAYTPIKSMDVSTTSIKDAESILSNLSQEEDLTLERLITDYHRLRLIAQHHESMAWFLGEYERLSAICVGKSPSQKVHPVISTGSKMDQDSDDEGMGAGISASASVELMEDPIVRNSTRQAQHLMGDLLLTLYVEVRTHCFFHLLGLSNPASLAQYAIHPFFAEVMEDAKDKSFAAAASGQLSNIAKHSFEQRNRVSGPADSNTESSEDAHTQALCRDLMRISDSLVGSLSPNKINYIFAGLGSLIGNSFIELATKMSTLSKLGLMKIRKNIITVHACIIYLFDGHNNTLTLPRATYTLSKAAFMDPSDRFGGQLKREGPGRSSIDFQDQLTATEQQNDPDGHESPDLSSSSSSEQSFNGGLSNMIKDMDSTLSIFQVERSELLRAVRFYDIFDKSATMSELLRRMELDICENRNQFREQDYRSLIALKCRNDWLLDGIEMDSVADGSSAVKDVAKARPPSSQQRMEEDAYNRLHSMLANRPSQRRTRDSTIRSNTKSTSSHTILPMDSMF